MLIREGGALGPGAKVTLAMTDSQNSDSAPDPESLSFEEAFRRLGEMVETLESGGLPLVEATALYEQGMSLVQRCNQLLQQTELKIAGLKETFAAPPAVVELDWDEEGEE